MRLTSLILLSLILYLVAIPCNDAIADKETKLFPSLIQTDQNHEKESHDDDYCSSFCVCNCCQTRNFVPYISVEVTPDTNVNKRLSRFNKDHYPKEVTGSIWRPPQLA